MREFNSYDVFFSLLRAGLWENEVRLASFGEISYDTVFQVAEEQAVVGLITAGLEYVVDENVPKVVILQFVGRTLQLEQQNISMNYFIGVLVDKMKAEGIKTLLVKGQGVARCYERPLWRSCGDVDFFLSEENYEKAKSYLIPLASHVESENTIKKHLGLTIEPWVIELHGSLRGNLSRRINKELDEIKKDTFINENVRTWINEKTQVCLLSVENDITYVFIHFLSHFYGGGIGLRQICDWCRLLWTYRDTIDRRLLERRLKKMGLMSEWKAFGAFAIDYLGMSSEAMPFYSPDKKWKRKADRICSFIMEVGNFGQNRDNSYYNKPFIIRKSISFGRRCRDLVRHARVFPIDSMRFLPGIVFNGMKAAMKGEHND